MTSPDDFFDILPMSSRFEWRIHDFLAQLLQETKTYRSPEFKWLNASWVLLLELGDIQKDSPASLHVMIENCEVSIKATIGAYIKCTNETLYMTRNFKEADIYRGDKATLILATDIDIQLITNRMKTINRETDLAISCCLINGIVDDRELFAHKYPLLRSFEPFQLDFRSNLFLNEKYANLTIKVKGKDFPVQKVWLMNRSEFFAAEFKENTPRNLERNYNIDDNEPDVIEDFLRFICFGVLVKFPPERPYQLYELADRYAVKDLKDACVRYMTNDMTLDMLYDAISLSEKYNLPIILKYASSFVARHANVILPSDEWSQFEKENSSLAMEVLKMGLLENRIKTNM